MSGRHSTPYLRAGNIGIRGLDLTDVFEMDFTPGEREVFALQTGDVLLAEASGSSSHVGRPAIWRDELPLCCFQNTVIRFRPHAVLPEYAYVVFRHYMAAGIFARVARGIGLLHLGARRFAELPFPVAPLAEQRRIATTVEDRLREGELAEESLRSALAATHRQDSEIIAAAVTGQLEPGLGSAGTSPPDDDIEIPGHWEWQIVDDIGDVTLGKTLGPAVPGSEIRPYLRVANVLEDEIDLTDVNETGFTSAEAERYELRPGDLLLNEGQSPELVGRPAMYGGPAGRYCFQNSLIRVRTHEGVDPQFALLVFRHYLRSGMFRRRARGSTNIAHLSRSRLAAMPFPVPPLDEQRAIVENAEQRLAASGEQRSAIEAALKRTESMATELLAAAVAGKLSEQDPSDEPAPELLERLGPPPSNPAVPRNVADSESARPRARKDPHAMRDLSVVLSQAGHPLTVSELCRAADVDINDVDAIEGFYIALRGALGDTVAMSREAGEESTLEVPDASA